MEKKARFLFATRDRNPNEAWKHTELWYEYRGHEYCVVRHNNGCMDKSLVQQHREEQERIDREIEEASRPKKERRYEDTAEYGFDMLWRYWEDGEWEEA